MKLYQAALNISLSQWNRLNYGTSRFAFFFFNRCTHFSIMFSDCFTKKKKHGLIMTVLILKGKNTVLIMTILILKKKKQKNTVLQLLKVQFRIHTFITDNKFANSWQVLQGKFRQTAFIPPQNRSLSYQCQLMTLDNIGTYSCSAWSIDIGNRFVNRITPHESLSGPW